MANQLNYSDKIETFINYRPDRPSKVDISLAGTGTKYVGFGTRTTDNVEVWVYNFNGTFAGHLRIDATDPALALTLLGDVPSILVDLDDLFNRMGINPGKYLLTIHFFRDEIGSENGYKMYVSNISPDRTEVRLTLNDVTPQTLKDVYEFIEPSVPKGHAEILLEDIFVNNKMNHVKIYEILDQLNNTLIAKLQYAGVLQLTTDAIQIIKNRAYVQILQRMQEDTTNFAIQDVELEQYFIDSIMDIITKMNNMNEIDSRIIFE